MAAPGQLVTITAPVHNIGWMHVDYTQVFFAYEATPENPLDDPNMIFIGDPFVLEDIAVGETKEASVQWDTTGLEPIIYPVYLFTANTEPPECYHHLTTTEYLVPVELYSFVAIPKDNAVELKWITSTEINNLGFFLYRSNDYFDGYEIINEKMIPGAGTSYEKHEYSFTDSKLKNGSPYFYRLAMINHEGKAELSKKISAVPHPENECSVRLDTWSNRLLFYSEDQLILNYRLTNEGEKCSLKTMIALLYNRQYIGDFITPVVVPFSSYLNLSDELFRYEWTGVEPEGEYLFLTLLSDPVDGDLKHIDITEFYYRGE